MSAPRKFDWDEARRLRAEGWTYVALAARFGVSVKAVSRACNDEQLRAHAARNDRWQRGGHCPDCGVPTTRWRAEQNRRCARCAGVARATSVATDALQCVTCREWKPDEAFPRSRANNARRGRHKQCTACLTVAKRAYRAKQRAAGKVPA